MRLHLPFYIRLISAFPLLPLLYFQGKKAKAAVPGLKAAQNPKGLVLRAEHKAQLNILSLGESAFAGIGIADHKKSITGILAQTISKQLDQTIHWEVIAKSGYAARQIKNELVPLIPTNKINLIIIGLGANDTFEGHFPNKWKRDITDLINSIRQQQPECPVLIAHLPPVNQFPVLPSLLQWFLGNFIDHYHIVNQQIAKELLNVFYIDQRIDFRAWFDKMPAGCKPEDLFCDGVHPGELAHQIWGNEIAEFVLNEHLLS